MEIRILNPRKALNKAFLKVKPNRTEIECFKSNLSRLLDRINDNESEEFHKNLVSDFLKETYYKQNYFINTKGRNDLVIHNTNNASGAVGVIVEAKKPASKTEMMKAPAPGDSAEQTIAKLNVKAFHELILYFLRERFTHKNIEIKYLVATNITEWFIFDATLFERLFAQNKNLVRQFNDFEAGRLADTRTDFFYKQVAEPFVAGIKSEIEFTWFDIRDYEKALRNADKKDDNQLIALFKLLSPEHLLKLPFANDSNSLNKRFYGELLHIIGLTETKEGNKKLIERNREGERNTGSLLENAIIQLDTLDKISRVEQPNQFGTTQQERLFNVGLELSITWINRILFLKLLEAQLVSYHKGDKSYEFLNLKKIRDYDDLNSLFFQVLACRLEERNEDVRSTFSKVPYLNSSLFEPTEIEHSTIFISNLRNDKAIPVYPQTVLKDPTGKKRGGRINLLAYLFEFLAAYDFASEGSEEIQEDNKTLINASVLGLIFEKINGYKDGSFFTPGFITMYMCRETIRRAVVQKFNETKGWSCSDIGSLYDRIEDRKEANKIINNLKICDPAVGSGHFLVSALNEMIAVKSDLKILQDRDGRRLKEYQFEVVNDELIVTDEDGELFEYNPNNKESQRIQETLFHEKQAIIENCLFGVDINPNSVKICRLRLWIELLKNAYYKNETELETLPNIDINIKCGNSLISRFALDADLKQALRKSAGKWTIDGYRAAVDTYRNAQTKEVKRGMERMINDIKSNFRSEISQNDPKVKRLNNLKGDLYTLSNQGQLFELSKNEKAEWNAKVSRLATEIQKLETEIEEIKSNNIFENAFEWRFEFPEVLDENGDFVGFDVVIGNPPYIRQEELSNSKSYLKINYETFASAADLYVYFVERGIKILRSNGTFSYILPNKWMRASYGSQLRQWVQQYSIQFLIDFHDLPVFEEATTYPCLWQITKSKSLNNTFRAVSIESLIFPQGLNQYVQEKAFEIDQNKLDIKNWMLVDFDVRNLLQRLIKLGKPLGELLNVRILRGVLTGLNEAFVINDETKCILIKSDPNSAEIIKPFLAGREIKRYTQPDNKDWIILIPKGFTIKKNLPVDDPHHLSEATPRYGTMPENLAWEWFNNTYPAVAEHLLKFKELAEKRLDQGDYWWELRACDYYGEFEKEKIMLPDISIQSEALIDKNNLYCVNTAYIIVGLSKYHLAILNSKLVLFFYSNLTQSIRGGYLRFIRQYLEQIPIPVVPLEIQNSLSDKVDEITRVKNELSGTSTSLLESQIDQLVYQLYGLTEEEIAIVESSVK